MLLYDVNGEASDLHAYMLGVGSDVTVAATTIVLAEKIVLKLEVVQGVKDG